MLMIDMKSHGTCPYPCCLVLLQRADLTAYPVLQSVVAEVGQDWWAKVVHATTSCEDCVSYVQGHARLTQQEEAEPEHLAKGITEDHIEYMNNHGEWTADLANALKKVREQYQQKQQQKRKRGEDEDEDEEPARKKTKA